MSNSKSKATSLKYFLFTIITLLVVAIAGGLYYAQNFLNEKATAIIKESIDQSTGSDNSAKLINVLNANKLYIDKAAAMTVINGNYQTQIRKDLDLYARSTGVSLSSIDMDVNDKTTSSFGLDSLQTKFIKVTFNNPVSYTGFIKFLQAVETNLPKMQVMNINIEGSIGSVDAVMIKPIYIKIYMDNEL